MEAFFPDLNPTKKMDPPECPVCLQPYEFAGGTVPRVLPCGHSTCESCLRVLPRSPAAHATVRCPACNVLVRIPDLGPSALPKNIDLLRFCSSNSLSPDPDMISISSSNPNPCPSFIPLLWTESLYSLWKDLVLPYDSISSVSYSSGLGTITAFTCSSSTPTGNRKVNLVPLAALNSVCSKPGLLRLSYMARVMYLMQRMGEDWMGKLHILMGASLHRRRGISRVLGLWMDVEESLSRLFIVCESFDIGLLDVLKNGKGMNEMVPFAMIATEMCEAVMELHSQGITCGCLLTDCFVFDEYGHCILDLSRVLVSGQRIFGEISATSIFNSIIFVSPEVYLHLQDSVSAADCGFDLCYGSDVWHLACIIAMILLSNAMLGNELFQGFRQYFSRGNGENVDELLLDCYEVWKEKVVSKLGDLLLKVQLESFLQVLKSSLSYEPPNRPQVKELWSCIRSLLIKTQVFSLPAMDDHELKEQFFSCSIIKDICFVPPKTINPIAKLGVGGASLDNLNTDQASSNRHISGLVKEDKFNAGLSDISDDDDGFKSINLDGHRDCITSLAVGGDFLFSASFDKTIKIWLLQDFSLLQTLKGHEHKVMAMAVIDGCQPLCISGDSASGIFVWHIGTSAGHRLLKNWYEHKDWRYSGIHSLAVSGTSHLYSGGGDKTIKAWSLQDYSLYGVMSGHKSTVSSLAVSDGVLYSGSWDGTIRLWSLFDHSLLSELSDCTPGSSYPVLSLSVDSQFVISSYEDGCIKVWKNDLFIKSVRIHKGAIFAMHLDSRFLCTGGWDMIVSIQELLEDELHVDVRPVASVMVDSVITSLLHWHGKLFIGFSNTIKVFLTTR